MSAEDADIARARICPVCDGSGSLDVLHTHALSEPTPCPACYGLGSIDTGRADVADPAMGCAVACALGAIIVGAIVGAIIGVAIAAWW